MVEVARDQPDERPKSGPRSGIENGAENQPENGAENQPEDRSLNRSLNRSENRIENQSPNQSPVQPPVQSHNELHFDSDDVILEAKELSLFYGDKQALFDISLQVPQRKITAIIGPSGCGKSTLLRMFNRMNEFIPEVTVSGHVHYRGSDLYAPEVDPVEVRRRIGMVFQKPNPFPKSIFDNIGWGPSINGLSAGSALNDLVEHSLRRAGLWDEVSDRLGDRGTTLSGGQQQRLCIARALAMEPEIILMDEPCSALDPVSTTRIEDLLFELKKEYSIVIVTHNMQQAARISDYTAFLENGRLVEYGETEQVFTRPYQKRTEEYVTGRFG